jgi:hypothetical protein
MRRIPVITIFVLLLVVLGSVVAWRLFAKQETERRNAVAHVQARKTYFKMVMTVDHPAGNIAREEYTLIDDDGKSKASYAVSNRTGTVAKFDDYVPGYDVSFAFGKAVQDGIWRLNTKHRRALDEDGYTIHVEQIADEERGSRTVTFTNPAFWAKTAEYHITLDPKKKTPTISDILKLQAVSNRDPDYLAVVNDFKEFGSPQFKQTITAAREKLLKS